MPRPHLSALCLGPALLLSLAGGARAADAPPLRRVLMVSIDGLAPATLQASGEARLALPNLRALAARGASAAGVSGVLPTLTYPVHTTLISGLTPRQHGILGNTLFDPFRKSNAAWQWYARDVAAPTLLTAAYRAGLITGAVAWPVTVGLEIDALVPEFWRSGSSHAEDKKLIEALSSTALFAEVEERLGAPLAWPPGDRERTELALHVLRTRKPQLLLLHLLEHDFAQHDFGPGSPAAGAALETADRELGRLLAALDELGIAEETLVVVVSDHGFLPIARELAPNVLLREAGLIELDREGEVTAWKAMFWGEGGSTLLRLADPADRATIDRVRALFERKAKEPSSGVRALLGAPEIAALGGDPATTPLALDAREGFAFVDRPDGAWSAPTRKRGHHGFAPVRPEIEAALVVAGPWLLRRGDLGTVPMTRIAPTLARYLGISLSPDAAPPLDWLAPAP